MALRRVRRVVREGIRSDQDDARCIFKLLCLPDVQSLFVTLGIFYTASIEATSLWILLYTTRVRNHGFPQGMRRHVPLAGHLQPL